MDKNELKIPAGLQKLIDNGFWPRDGETANRQNLISLVEPERIRQLRPRESRIFLYPFPFATVADALASDGGSNSNFWADHQILPDKALVIGDFGLGSDAPIILDYSQNFKEARVLRLLWNKDSSTEWIYCADSFDEFASILGLPV